MADRTIDTYISLHGEQEWRRSIDACKASLAEYRSEINLLNTQYNNQGYTLEALMKKEKAQQGILDTLIKEQKLYADRIEDINKAMQDQSKANAESEEVLDELNDAYKLLASGQSKSKVTLEELQAVLDQFNDDLAAGTEAQKNHGIQLDKAQKDYNNVSAQIVKTDDELQKLTNSVRVMQDPLSAMQLSLEDVSDELKIMAQLVQDKVNQAFEKLYDVLKQSAQSSIAFEANLTKVQKTTNMTADEIEAFGTRLKRLSTTIPITTEELTKIAEAAGQLGVASDDIEAFTEVMAMMGVTTNFSAEEAATSLAQLASVTGMTSDEYSRLGSSIVAVGNNFATTEKNVTLLTQRFAATGASVGMTEAQMVGLATAVSSLGVAADMGGTALQTLINKLDTAVSTGEGLQKWANLMGLSTDELTKKWKDDATGALQLLIKSLGEAESSLAINLKSVGISEQRLTKVVSLLANAESETELLTRALQTSTEAWDANNALQEEANKAFETTESKILMFKNSVDALKIAVGDQLLPVIGLAAETGTNAINVLTEFVEKNPDVVTAVSALTAAAGAFASVVTLNLPAVSGAIEKVIEIATSPAVLNGFTALTVVIAALGTAALIAGSKIETDVEAARDLAKQARDTREAVEESVESVTKQNAAWESQIFVLSNLVEKENKTATDMAVIKNMVDELNQAIPSLNLSYDAEADALTNVATGAQMTAEGLRAMAMAMAEQAVQEEKIRGLSELYVEQIQLNEQLTAKKNELSEAEQKYTELLATDTEAANYYEATVNDLAAAVRILQGEYDAVTGKITDYEAALGSAAEATETEAISEIDRLNNSIQQQRELFNDAEKSALSHMQSLVSGFDYVAEASTMEYETIMRNLSSQQEFYTNYADNLQNLNNRNIDGLQDMLQQMQDEGTLTADMVATLAGRSDEGLTDIVNAWNRVKDAQKIAAGEQADLLTQSTKKIQKYQDELNDLSGTYNVYVNTYYRSYGTPPTGTGHAQGLEYVPYDDYAALLHEGEMVLTKAEARAYRDAHTHGQSVVTNNNRNYGGVTLNVYAQQGQDVDSLAQEIMYRIDDATKRKEAVWA